ncbi:MAG: metallophosphoesterase [Clostridia bacterium]|nr:metallophosphoesterase [Clostridia bacterium]
MIYVTGDKHGTDLVDIHVFCDNNPNLTKSDYLIIAGDFGGVFLPNEVENNLDEFSKLPFTMLFVDGNHENFDLLYQYPVKNFCGGKVHKIRDDIMHLMRGEVYEIDGIKIFTFGGATSVDKDRRFRGFNWWEQEIPSQSEIDNGLFNLKKHGNTVDYVITHSCDTKMLYYPIIRNADRRKCDQKPENAILDIFEDYAKYKHWYFGHFHVDAKLNDKKTVLYRAIIPLK